MIIHYSSLPQVIDLMEQRAARTKALNEVRDMGAHLRVGIFVEHTVAKAFRAQDREIPFELAKKVRIAYATWLQERIQAIDSMLVELGVEIDWDEVPDPQPL